MDTIDNVIPFKGAAAFLSALNAPVITPRRNILRNSSGLSRRAHHAYLSALATACKTDLDDEVWDVPDVKTHMACLYHVEPWATPVNDP